jgi:hypothetical protein
MPFYKDRASPVINVLFAARWVLILCSITKKSFLLPAPGRSSKDIFIEFFDDKFPAISGVHANDSNATEKHSTS